MIKRTVTPYQILRKLTSQTQTERFEVCWKEGSQMTGQKDVSRDSIQFSPKRTNVHQSSTRSLRQESGYIDVFLTEIEKGNAPFLCHIGFSRYEHSVTLGGLVPGGFGTSEGRKNSVLLTRVAIGSKLRPEVQALRPLEEPSRPIVCD